MRIEEACEALASGKCIEVKYDGLSRIIEIHAVGYSTAGNAVMRAYQVEGGSVSNNKVGWKMMKLDEAQKVALLDLASGGPRPGYSKGDKGMTRIVCEL